MCAAEGDEEIRVPLFDGGELWVAGGRIAGLDEILGISFRKIATTAVIHWVSACGGMKVTDCKQPHQTMP